MTLKFPRFETTAFHPPPWLKPIISRDTRLSDLFYFHFTRIYIFSSFFLSIFKRDTWFFYRWKWVEISVERKERKRVRGRVKRRKDRSSIQIARGIFFKALSKADPLCCCCNSVLDYNHRGKGGQWNVDHVHAINSMHLEQARSKARCTHWQIYIALGQV